jgi:hypothetical protein
MLRSPSVEWTSGIFPSSAAPSLLPASLRYGAGTGGPSSSASPSPIFASCPEKVGAGGCSSPPEPPGAAAASASFLSRCADSFEEGPRALPEAPLRPPCVVTPQPGPAAVLTPSARPSRHHRFSRSSLRAACFATGGKDSIVARADALRRMSRAQAPETRRRAPRTGSAAASPASRARRIPSASPLPWGPAECIRGRPLRRRPTRRTASSGPSFRGAVGRSTRTRTGSRHPVFPAAGRPSYFIRGHTCFDWGRKGRCVPLPYSRGFRGHTCSDRG